MKPQMSCYEIRRYNFREVVDVSECTEMRVKTKTEAQIRIDPVSECYLIQLYNSADVHSQ